MKKRRVSKLIRKVAIATVERTVGKSVPFSMHAPDIPAVIKKKNNKAWGNLKDEKNNN